MGAPVCVLVCVWLCVCAKCVCARVCVPSVCVCLSRHLGCFDVLASMNEATCEDFYLEIPFLLANCKGIELCINRSLFMRNCQIVFQSSWNISVPAVNTQASLVCHILTSLLLVRVLDFAFEIIVVYS